MTPDNTLSERVAVLEAQFAELRRAVIDMIARETHIGETLNTINVSLGRLTQRVEDITFRRSVWSNPLVWTNLLSLAIAGTAMALK